MIKAIQNIRLKKIAAVLFSIIAITAIAVFIFMRFQGGVVKAAFNYFVEERMGRALGAKVTMNSINTNFLGPTVLKSFTVVKESAEDTPFIFKSEKFIIYNNMSQVFFDRIFKKAGFNKGINLVFKIENGCLLKGEKPIFENITGFGKIVNNNLIFDDISGKCYNFPLSVHGKLSGERLRLDLNIESSFEKLKAKVHLSNYALRPHAAGVLEFDEAQKFYFSGDLNISPGESIAFNNVMLQDAVSAMGKINFSKKRFYAELKKKPNAADPATAKDTVSIIGNFSKQGFLQVSAFFDHVQLGRLDFQSQLDCDINFSDKNNIKGFIKTSGTILDFRPFKEIEGSFLIKDRSLIITGLRLESDYNLAGFVNLYKPYQMDLTFDIKDSNLSQLLLVSDVESESKVSGKVSGQARTSGSLDSLITTVKLECKNGNLGNLDYESMNINLRGQGPVLAVSDSRILRKQGYIDLSGEVDLNSLWSQEPAKGLDWACGNEAIVWQGWDIVKETNSKQIEMAKGAGKQKEFMVTFKSYLNDEQSWQDSQGYNQNQAVAVEYNLDEAKKVKMQIKNNEEVVSLEHKVRF